MNDNLWSILSLTIQNLLLKKTLVIHRNLYYINAGHTQKLLQIEIACKMTKEKLQTSSLQFARAFSF